MNRKKALVAWTLMTASLLGSVGCYQTHMGGMTLPSGHYMKDRAEYFTPMPDFPLPRELATMQRQAAEAGYYTPPAPRQIGGAANANLPPAPGTAQPQTPPVTPAPGIPQGAPPAPANPGGNPPPG